MNRHSWLRCTLEAAVGLIIYYPIRTLGEHMLVDPVGTPMQIWPLSEWLVRGPDLLELGVVGIMIWFVAGMLRAQRKELFDE